MDQLEVLCITFMQTAQTLSSVVLFDTLSFDFQINSIILESNDGKQKSVMDESANRFEHRLNQKIDPSEKILVKVSDSDVENDWNTKQLLKHGGWH